MNLRTTRNSALFAALAAATGLAAGYAMASQPRMNAALDHLNAAERELVAADNDKGGHRQRALELTRRAQEQVRKGMRYDRRN
jgi:Spy/CpxP family protein refolding chaperone